LGVLFLNYLEALR